MFIFRYKNDGGVVDARPTTASMFDQGPDKEFYARFKATEKAFLERSRSAGTLVKVLNLKYSTTFTVLQRSRSKSILTCEKLYFRSCFFIVSNRLVTRSTVKAIFIYLLLLPR